MRARALAWGLVRIPLRRVPLRWVRGPATVDLLGAIPLEDASGLEVGATELVEARRGDERAFGLLADALRRAGCVGLGRVEGARVLLRPHGRFLLVAELLDGDELRARGETRLDVEADSIERELWDGLIARLRAGARPTLAKARPVGLEPARSARRGA